MGKTGSRDYDRLQREGYMRTYPLEGIGSCETGMRIGHKNGIFFGRGPGIVFVETP